MFLGDEHGQFLSRAQRNVLCDDRLCAGDAEPGGDFVRRKTVGDGDYDAAGLYDSQVGDDGFDSRRRARGSRPPGYRN